jgi:hypothetical protein
VNIDDLIADLTPISVMKPPSWYLARLAAVLLAYAALSVNWLGIRPDFAVQLARPEFVLELLLLLIIIITSVLAAVHLAYPDSYQRSWLLRLPMLAGMAFVALLVALSLMPVSETMVIPKTPPHMACLLCTACIGVLAIIPTALIMAIQRGGASVQPAQAGMYVVFAATALGCLMLRIEEQTDDIAHLVLWHYLPTLLFAAIGAWAGRKILRW